MARGIRIARSSRRRRGSSPSAWGAHDYHTAYQSRSGRPEDPWLGPDVCDYLREARAGGLEAAVLSPVGFLCDHVEVLYDLDIEAADVCRAIGLPMARAQAVNDSSAVSRHDGGRRARASAAATNARARCELVPAA